MLYYNSIKEALQATENSAENSLTRRVTSTFQRLDHQLSFPVTRL